MRSLITTGKVVCAYTGSPWRLPLVEIAFFKDTGTLVPAGIMISLGPTGSLGRSAGTAGLGVCATAAPNSMRETIRVRITASVAREKMKDDGVPLKLYDARLFTKVTLQLLVSCHVPAGRSYAAPDLFHVARPWNRRQRSKPGWPALRFAQTARL